MKKPRIIIRRYRTYINGFDTREQARRFLVDNVPPLDEEKRRLDPQMAYREAVAIAAQQGYTIEENGTLL